ncbi:MAG: hypothetical protein ACFFD1_03285 [Candidatus Thorarchaeota archaeon]
MSTNWLDGVLTSTNNKILEMMSLQIGTDFHQLSEVSKTIITNRYGDTAVLELQLKSEDDKGDYSIGFIAKKVFDQQGYFNYVVESADRFLNIMETRQIEWNGQKESLNLDEITNQNIPENVYAPKIQFKNQKTNVIQFEILPRFVSRPKSGVSPETRYMLSGYTLSRFHGMKKKIPDTTIYAEWFPYLESENIDYNILQKWREVINSSQGGVDYIFGDYSLDSVQYNALIPGKGKLDSLCLIDPVLISNGDRSEDLGYLMYTIAEKYVETALWKSDPKNVSSREILKLALEQLLIKSAPMILKAYQIVCPDLVNLYQQNLIPIDFFTGAYLLSRSRNESNVLMAKILKVLGTQLIEAHPISDMLVE